MAVYRMKFVPTVLEADLKTVVKLYSDKYEEMRKEAFEFFQQFNIIGTGWGWYTNYSIQKEDELKQDLVNHYAKKNFKTEKERNNRINGDYQNIRILLKLEKDDLIWMTYQKKYWLFRVTEKSWGKEWQDPELSKHKNRMLQLDLGHYIKGEWKEIGDDIHVPGKILNNMGIGFTMRQVYDADELSQYAWNQTDSKLQKYSIKKLTMDSFWKMATDREVEGLVLTYLQIEKNCIVNTETVKHSTKTYECEMIGRDGTYYYPQVKTGAVSDKDVSLSKFMEEIKAYRPESKVFGVVFYASDKYGTYSDDNLIKIEKSDLINFIQDENNSKYLSESLKAVLEMLNDQEKD